MISKPFLKQWGQKARDSSMPFINVKSSAVISAEKQEALKAGFGQGLKVFDKSEQWLMVDFEGSSDLYFGGVKAKDAAMVQVNLMGEPEDEAVKAFTKIVCGLAQEQLGADPEKTYVVFYPVSNVHWGWNNQTF
jgi:phenylpyruvate tautomerase PptA (4-oxalocrotonate tautomerase family)